MGPVAVSPFELHPVKIANQLFTLNEYAGGRASIVIGGGGGTVIGMGLKPGRRDMMPRMVRAVRECAEFLRGAASERPFDYDGELYQVQGYKPEWVPDDSALIYVAATKPQMLRMASRVGDGIMMSDVTLPRLEESMAILRQGLNDNRRDLSAFRISNLYTWHVKADRQEAYREARAKLFVRGMLERWYIAPFLTPGECDLVEDNFAAFAQAYIRNSPDIEGVQDELVDKLVDNLTWTGDDGDIDRIVAEMQQFKDGGVTEMAIRLYGDPERSVRLIAERVMPVLQ